MQTVNGVRELSEADLPILGKYLPSRSHAWPWIIFLVALLARLTWAAYSHFRRTSLHELEFPDEIQYWLIANNFVNGLGLRDEIGHLAGRMPVFVTYLTLFVSLPNGILIGKLAHCVIGSAVAVATYALGKRVFGAGAGILAGLFLALDPFYIFFSTYLLTEIPFALLLTLFYLLLTPWIMDRGRRIGFREWFAATLLAILLIYVRESSLLLMLLMIAFVVVVKHFDRRVMVGAIFSVLLIVLALFPWALRNKSVTGSWVWLTTRGGITLYDGVGPQATGQSYLDDVKQMPAVVGLTEVEYDRYFKRESFRCLREEPGRMLRLAGAKLSIFWNPFPNAAYYNKLSTRLIASSWTIPTFAIMALGIVLLWRRGGEWYRVLLFLLLPGIYLTAIHMVFVSSIRYRMGAVPMLYTIAAFALLFLVDKWRTRRAWE